ncbi:TIGR04540 family protein [Clostridium sardiniense]|uniref:TIGR04540 family protein n=1 Tax=Clostridium sardiniense TaxID=29369 RepID=A0ABS7KVW7_CLOSR|nr:TIGR04540 family protein [Clostridium sardiniense]MBM7834185.1 uncharacterized protein (TIGR04540 family) [Clostridium sardiniense]MBY0754965.1 TIGR04540 family protein [Clostridium sardiniense]MDQ0459181.1 uncharacterized protein (TIGR04540 family) [Clostridium sardiniense]
MRAVYKNPKELATCLKDLIDQHLDDLITYEKLEEKIVRIVKANGNSVYKDGHMPVKLSNILGEERKDIIDKIMANN